DLAGIGLSGHGVDRLEAHLAGDQAVQLADLGVVAGEQGQEARLRAGRALDPAKTQVLQPRLDFVEVEDEVVTPQAGAFSDGRELGRLEVRVAERRFRPPGFGEAGQGVDHADELVAEYPQPVAHQDQVGVVGGVTTGGAKVNDVPAERGDLGERVDVGHDVV